MDLHKPKFADSEWIIKEAGNWRLKPGAPDDVVREYAEFMARLSPADPGMDEPMEIVPNK